MRRYTGKISSSLGREYHFQEYGIGNKASFSQANSYLVNRFSSAGTGISGGMAAYAGLSVMAFDSGVTQEAWNFVIAVWLYPIWPIVFAISSWVAYWRKRDRLAGILTTFTFLPILILLLIVIGANSFYFMTT